MAAPSAALTERGVVTTSRFDERNALRLLLIFLFSARIAARTTAHELTEIVKRADEFDEVCASLHLSSRHCPITRGKRWLPLFLPSAKCSRFPASATDTKKAAGENTRRLASAVYAAQVLFFLRRPANPTRPVPSSSNVHGSGVTTSIDCPSPIAAPCL